MARSPASSGGAAGVEGPEDPAGRVALAAAGGLLPPVAAGAAAEATAVVVVPLAFDELVELSPPLVPEAPDEAVPLAGGAAVEAAALELMELNIEPPVSVASTVFGAEAAAGDELDRLTVAPPTLIVVWPVEKAVAAAAAALGTATGALAPPGVAIGVLTTLMVGADAPDGKVVVTAAAVGEAADNKEDREVGNAAGVAATICNPPPPAAVPPVIIAISANIDMELLDVDDAEPPWAEAADIDVAMTTCWSMASMT